MSTVAVLVPRNQRGVDVIDALKRRNIDFVELLGSTSSTRAAAGRLGDIVSALADPQSSARLAKAYLAWRRPEEDDANDDFQRQVAELLRKCSEVETFVSPRNDRDWLYHDLTPGPRQIRQRQAVMEELEEFRTCRPPLAGHDRPPDRPDDPHPCPRICSPPPTTWPWRTSWPWCCARSATITPTGACPN